MFRQIVAKYCYTLPQVVKRGVLTSTQKQIRSDISSTLNEISCLVTRVPEYDKKDILDIKTNINDLNDFFMLTVAGGFSVGKSSFLNSLLKKSILKVGTVPTTSAITLIKYGHQYTEHNVDDKKLIILPNPLLSEITVVDTPGLNSVYGNHEAATLEFVPRSDIIFIVMSSTQAFSNTEKEFIEYVKKWNKKCVIILSKKDLLENGDLEEIKSFIKTQFHEKIGYIPEILPVTTKTDYDNSGLPAVNKYIVSTLTCNNKIKIKLTNSLSSVELIIRKYMNECTQRKTLIEPKKQELQDIVDMKDECVNDLNMYLDHMYNDIRQTMLETEAKTNKLIEEHVKISNFSILFNKQAFSQKFKSDIEDPLVKELQLKINLLLDTFINKINSHYSKINKQLQNCSISSELVKMGNNDILNNLVDSNTKGSIDLLIKDDSKLLISSKMSDEIRTAYLNTMLMQLSTIFSIGVFTQVSLLALPFEPIIIPSIGLGAGVLGLCILPYKKYQMKKQMGEQTIKAFENMKSMLNTHFKNEITKYTSTIDAIIVPRTTLIDKKNKIYDELITGFLEKDNMIQTLRKKCDDELC